MINILLTRQELWEDKSIFNSNLSVDRIRELISHHGTHVHMVGVLGAGMLPLAKILTLLGCRVTGSDISYKRAVDCEFPVFEHAPTLAEDADIVAYSLAVDESDIDILAAKSGRAMLISRAQLLGAVMLGYKTRIGVSGSHGKSTTTALIDRIFCEAGLSPTTVSGAALSDGAYFRLGTGDVFIYEACEYKDSFLHLFPTHQVITSLELDHTDYFHSIDSIRTSFIKSAARAECLAIISETADIAPDVAKHLPVLTYGKGKDVDFRYEILDRAGGVCHFTVKYGENEPILLKTRLLGEFNVANICAATGVACELGIATDAIQRAIEGFQPIARRLEYLGTSGCVDVYYDYAHHPTEIALVIDTLRETYGACTVIFRPHTYSRTESLWRDFLSSLSHADRAVIVDIYPARERSIPGITSERLAMELGDRGVYSSFERAAENALATAYGAVVLMGAGEVDTILRDLIGYCENKNSRST